MKRLILWFFLFKKKKKKSFKIWKRNERVYRQRDRRLEAGVRRRQRWRGRGQPVENCTEIGCGCCWLWIWICSSLHIDSCYSNLHLMPLRHISDDDAPGNNQCPEPWSVTRRSSRPSISLSLSPVYSTDTIVSVRCFSSFGNWVLKWASAQNRTGRGFSMPAPSSLFLRPPNMDQKPTLFSLLFIVLNNNNNN